MLNNIPVEFRKFNRHRSYLKKILRDTNCAIEDIKNGQVLDEIKQQLTFCTVETLHKVLDNTPAFVVLGQTCFGKALFVNFLLNYKLLPQKLKSNWRWVKISYGIRKSLRLTLGSEYEIVDSLKSLQQPWTGIAEDDLKRDNSESPTDHCPTIEVEIPAEILKENINIYIPPDCGSDELQKVLSKQLDSIYPIFIYAVTENALTESDIHNIRVLKQLYSDAAIIFLRIGLLDNKDPVGLNKIMIDLKTQLSRLGFLPDYPQTPDLSIRKALCSECMVENEVISYIQIKDHLHLFVRNVLKAYLLKLSALLSELHNVCLRIFILSAFDMAREIQITPRRIHYAQDVEQKLFKSLMDIALIRQTEMVKIIQDSLEQMRNNIDVVLDGYEYQENEIKFEKVATMEIHHLVFQKLTNIVASRLVHSVGYLRESYTGTLQRCLESLEKNCHELEGSLLASDAVKQIVNAAYNIDLKSFATFSLVQSFVDRLRKLVQNFPFKWHTCSQKVRFDREWQRQVILELLDSLSYHRLAKTISSQFQEHVKSSHEAFHSAMRLIENQLSGQLEETEEQRIDIRKRLAPKFARLALESTSLCDLIRWGMPRQIVEIGRGQYGVVFACEPWGGVQPCAVKSVVPPDERHWNDLAMEFYYTRTIPEHPRIVKLRGSVIDHNYGNGCLSAVLLVMERMKRDLFCALKDGLTFIRRIQIAIDVVEGIRYLHSQGLVHRDVKLKNVLLDGNERAMLTDFGFCIPEAMMSGSVVGTPVHMAPELLSGRYDSSVDVYAFGVLFWFLCAGRVELPGHFEHFMSKEQLWNSVKKGMRPECLPNFDTECWNLMEQCWAAEPCERPLLGDVQPQLEDILNRATKK
ncbi:dual serine/threonine and tyrosine protein kinase-like isoform X1 [Onthophagus taurus]|uniref:dual serine/threonine and tyrosine protein kinase-like isoform X1 n=1 Tax=Onthophagus taurus TaxID=166361 RepID=UPI000C20331B|nr:dual serine/threonine and tyrosine protein kinase-like isoform X1 [Onthophagus taurus]